MPQAIYQQGIDCFRHNDFEKGFKYIEQASNKQYLPALKELGVCYLHGVGVDVNLAHAVNYFKQAKKHPESQFELAKLYYFGYGVKKNRKKAKKLLMNYYRVMYLMQTILVEKEVLQNVVKVMLSPP